MFKTVSKFTKAVTWIVVLAQVVLPAHAAISNLPPMVKPAVPPNVFFTLDDSGSMTFEILPDVVGPVGDANDRITINGETWNRTNIASDYCNVNVEYCWVTLTFPQPLDVYNINGNGYYGDRASGVVGFNDNITVARMRSAVVNPAYYDPAIRYTPWVDPNTITVTNPYGSPMPNADPSKAKWNPVAPTGGSNAITINLAANATSTASWLNNGAYDLIREQRTFYPATYYVYKPRATYQAGVDPVCSTSVLKCFTKIEIKSGVAFGTKGSGRTDCSGTSCTYNEELQNFANWFQYYRSRINIARAGVGQAFAKQDSGMRVGFGTINTSGTKISGVGTDFSIAAKKSFLNSLYSQIIPRAGTPLRRSMGEIGEYFRNTTKNGPWETVPGNTGTSNQIACRQNYNILMTDGYWNGSGASGLTDVNVDGTDGPSMTSVSGKTFKYLKSKPYMDGEANTLADVAMYYWVNDLRTDLVNNVPYKEGVNDAFWQHLVQYTVGLGVKGSLNPETDLPLLTSTGTGSKTWPTAATNQVDDLWHAAVNSRGKFFSAANPAQFADALDKALDDIADRSGSAAAVATSNTILGSNTKIYTSSYMTKDWSGRLVQHTLNATTGNIQSTDWNTDTSFPAASARKIFSSGTDGNGGMDFLYGQLNSTQKQIFDTAAGLYPTPNIVNGEQLFNYLRGEQDSSKPFRKRLLLLGDLVNSDPQYIKEGRNAGYGSLPASNQASKYLAFYERNLKTRPGTVYVGSNDGMLHAFNASEDTDKGKERFAFVPQAVMANLPELAKPNYVHRFYVDATPMIADAALYPNDSEPWRTVLVSGLGAGGKSIFALDVTDPVNFDKTKVMWERGSGLPSSNTDFTNDLGYTFGVPQVGRMRDGRWVALVGNGYESASGKALLYILDLKTGNVLYKLDTGTGNTTTRNGLSTPKILYNSDATINSVYAGDLLGNMWKFEFVESNTSTPVTTPQLGLGGNPLYRSNRPITSQPQLYPHPKGGFMVLFGTGKIYEEDDATSIIRESLYGIWDKGLAVTSSQVVAQKFSFTDPYYKVTSNTVDWNTKRGWVIPLDIKNGERLVTDPNVFENQVIFTTIVPNTGIDPCALDGLTTTLHLNPLTGGALSYPAIDSNGDGKVTRADPIVSGKQTSATQGTTIVKTGDGNYKVFQVPSADATGAPPAQSRKGMDLIPTVRLWRQILNVQ